LLSPSRSDRANKTSFVSVDWGTSSFRAYWIVEGAVRDKRTTGDGILAIPAGGHAAALRAALAGWAFDGPVVLSGMIGSRQGWKEAPYAACPARATDIAAACLRWDEPEIGRILLVPGIKTIGHDGVPDVMRGEETQILGAMRALGVSGGTFILPGTHSKRAIVRDGAIEQFATFMTGEVFAALKSHTILARLMAEGPSDGSGFRRGVREGANLKSAGGLLHRLFATRTLGLFDLLPPAELADYLSGLLIGAELADSLSAATPEAYVIGSGALSARYAEAADVLGFRLISAPEDCVVLGQSLILEDAA
jgi:2-dehydro-3-deoxygalactonokinase